jgi:hypothetical protein
MKRSIGRRRRLRLEEIEVCRRRLDAGWRWDCVPGSESCVPEKVPLLVPIRRLFGRRKDGSGAVSRAMMASVRTRFGFDVSPNLRSKPAGAASPRRRMVGLDFSYFVSTSNAMRQRCCVYVPRHVRFQTLRDNS